MTKKSTRTEIFTLTNHLNNSDNNMESDNKTCGNIYPGICFDKILSLGKINSCDHLFHYKCIYRWSRISNNCPTCRVTFTEICHLKGTKLLKKIKIHEDSHSTEEDISNSDIEEWQAVCPVCESSSQDFMLMCEGEFGCSNVCHSYCLNIDPIPEHWVCQDCEVQESESLADENSESEARSSSMDSESVSEAESDPEAEYEPAPESPELRRSSRHKRMVVARRHSSRIKYSSSSEEDEVLSIDSDENSNNSFDDDENYKFRQRRHVTARKRPLRANHSPSSEESEALNLDSEEDNENILENEENDQSFSSDDYTRHLRSTPLKRLKKNSGGIRKDCDRKKRGYVEDDDRPLVCRIPLKRNRGENDGYGETLKEFVDDLVSKEIKNELEMFRGEHINQERIRRTLIGIILRNNRLRDYNDNRTVQKMKTVIRNYIAGLV